MSASNDAVTRKSPRWDELIECCLWIRSALENGHLDQIPPEVAPNLLTSATLLFARASQSGRKSIEVFREDADVTPTDVVVTVSAMLRAADLNSFDLAMWFTGRPPEP